MLNVSLSCKNCGNIYTRVVVSYVLHVATTLGVEMFKREEGYEEVAIVGVMERIVCFKWEKFSAPLSGGKY